MNFVIVALHFFPQSDAESFCSTRFASALAKAGHRVHVVTLDAEARVSAEIYSALVDPRVMVEKIPVRVGERGPIWSRLRFLTHEWESTCYGDCIAAVKRALDGMDHPILIARALPLGSLIVAWHCRKHAYRWIAHLSDPIPWFFWNSINGRLRYHFDRIWAKRAFRDADGISVTCAQVCRFFHENFEDVFDRQTVHVTPHIGDELLKRPNVSFEGAYEGKLIALPGTLYRGRGIEAVCNAVKTLNQEGIACTLAIVGAGAPDQVEELRGIPHVLMVEDATPTTSLAIVNSADVLFVSDFESRLPYSPRIMSKFVYQIFEDKPMVVRAPKISAQHDYCERFPDCGMFYADDASPDSLLEALRKALTCDNRQLDRSGLRREFQSDKVAEEFVEFVRGL